MILLITFCIYSFAVSITPGTVNVLILSHGMNHGLKPTFSFILGAIIAFDLLLIFIGVGFQKIISTYPVVMEYITILGSLFIINMGYKLCKSTLKLNHEKSSSNPNFFNGLLMQLVNPKAWIACVSAISLFTASNNIGDLSVLIIVYTIISFICLSLWAAIGSKLSTLLSNGQSAQYINVLLGLLLIAMAVYMIVGLFLPRV